MYVLISIIVPGVMF